MSRKTIAPSFDSMLASLRSAQFDVKDVPGVAGQVLVWKYGCAAIVAATAGASKTAAVALVAKPGFVLGGEISRLLDRGNQKFLKTNKLEVPATADHLRAVHLFSEELKQVTGGISLYNESLGTVSDRYVYDRLKGRDLPESERTPRPWELPAEAGK
jgi:hypothetical protein